jgi:DNA-directed RNA polymerase subunit RPC12/RpoP
MGDSVTLTCPTCGGKLQITPDIDRFACTHCGNEHIVKRSEGIIAIQPLAESLTALKRATDRTASELAIRRLTEELNQLQAGKQQAEGKVTEHCKVIAAHNAKKEGCQTAIVAVVTLLLCYGAYLASEEFAKDAPQGSLLSGLTWVFMIWLGAWVLMAVWFPLKWLLSSDPKPERKVAEENLRAAEAEVGALTQALAQKQAEIAQQQQLVGLGA